MFFLPPVSFCIPTVVQRQGYNGKEPKKFVRHLIFFIVFEYIYFRNRVDGEAMNSELWLDNEPNDLSGHEDCVILKMKKNWMAKDFDCKIPQQNSASAIVICEY